VGTRAGYSCGCLWTVVAPKDPSCGARRLQKLEHVTRRSPRAPLSDERVCGVARVGCFVQERATRGAIHAHRRRQPPGAAAAHFRRRSELESWGQQEQVGGWRSGRKRVRSGGGGRAGGSEALLTRVSPTCHDEDAMADGCGVVRSDKRHERTPWRDDTTTQRLGSPPHTCRTDMS
jgi:hypothetical protein